MRHAVQIVDEGGVLVETSFISRTPYEALRLLLETVQVKFDANCFYKKQDFVCYDHGRKVYRARSSKTFGC